MDSAFRLQRLFRIGIAVAAVLLAAAAALLVFRKGQYDQLELEYAAARSAALLVERYAENGTVGELPDDVSGFGVYDASGTAVIAVGTAPEAITPPTGGEEIERTNGELRLLRSIGGRVPAASHQGTTGRGRAQQGTTLTPAPRLGIQYLVLDYDASASIGRRRLENAALIGSGSLTAAVLLLIILLYRRLQRAQKTQADQARLAQLGEAARTLAHEIKNPLTAAQMQTALLRRAVDEREHGRLAVLDEELSRIRTLTDQIREFLKSGEGSPIELDPAAIARETADRLPLQVAVHDPPRPLRVVMDSDRFRSVITNLLQNAADAISESATAEDRGGDDVARAQPVEVFVRRHRGMVEIVVADRGPGIPVPDRSRVFDPFFTTKTHGSGVGLAVSRRFVEQAGGSLEARARDGGGTEMIIRLRGTEHESTHS